LTRVPQIAGEEEGMRREDREGRERRKEKDISCVYGLSFFEHEEQRCRERETAREEGTGKESGGRTAFEDEMTPMECLIS
jgi:hypothetical protein